MQMEALALDSGCLKKLLAIQIRQYGHVCLEQRRRTGETNTKLKISEREGTKRR